MAKLSGTLVLPDGLALGSITFGGHIEAISRAGGVPAVAPLGAPYVLPGFIDTHVHGGAGADTMDGADGVRTLARFHALHGTTSLLPTTITNPWENVVAALRGVADAMGPGVDSKVGAAVLGAHLEGPFISPGRLGAQPPFAVLPEPGLVEEVLALGVVRVVTLAPELEHAEDAARRFARARVRVSLGHTNATADQVAAVVEVVRAAGGVIGFTHLFNAMTQLGSREAGAVGAALADPNAFAELILDLHHVSATSFLAAKAAKEGRLHLVTDAMRACGMPDGAAELGGQQVNVKDGVVRLADGTLAGSVLTLDQALRNAVASGASLAAASRALAGVPARYLGLADRGELRVGARADMVVLDAELRVQDVFVAGRPVA